MCRQRQVGGSKCDLSSDIPLEWSLNWLLRPHFLLIFLSSKIQGEIQTRASKRGAGATPRPPLPTCVHFGAGGGRAA
jgi:hypothetical protein